VAGQIKQAVNVKGWSKPDHKVFAGRETIAVDARGRIRMPLHLADGNEREVVVTISMHGPYLEIWPKWRFEEFYAMLWQKSSMSTFRGFMNYGDRDFIDNMRDLVESHTRVTMDESFRLVLPQTLREEVGIGTGDSVVVVGQVEFVEIWPEGQYAAYKTKRTNRDLSRVFNAEGLGTDDCGGDVGSDASSVDIDEE